MSQDPIDHEISKPAETIHFEELRVEPWPDGHRVRVHVTLSPFTVRPNLEAAIFNADEIELQRVNIVENTEVRLVFTMHLRGAQIPGKFRLLAQVYFDPDGILDQRDIQFEILDSTDE
jgi:hypothetical protein